MIRHFLKNDIRDVMDIWLNANIEGHPFLSPQYFLQDYRRFQEDDLLSCQNTIYDLDGKVVGFLSVNMRLEIKALAIHPAYQRSGLATSLVEDVLGRLGRLHVTIFEKNEAALLFFKDQGFMLDQRWKDEATGLFCLRFVKDSE